MTYDRRGLSRSTLDEPVEDMRLQMHSDDAHRLLAALTTKPAYVFGSSVGALIRFDLVICYPEQAACWSPTNIGRHQTCLAKFALI